jgi:kynurenine 3-monooxygenase
LDSALRTSRIFSGRDTKKQAYQDLIFFNLREYWYNDGKVQLTIKTNNENIKTDYEINTINPDLLLGCDGLSSTVRTFLENRSGDAKEKFTPVSIPSPTAGLKYKMLTLKNRFPLPVYKDIKENNGTIDIFPTVD